MPEITKDQMLELKARMESRLRELATERVRLQTEFFNGVNNNDPVKINESLIEAQKIDKEIQETIGTLVSLQESVDDKEVSEIIIDILLIIPRFAIAVIGLIGDIKRELDKAGIKITPTIEFDKKGKPHFSASISLLTSYHPKFQTFFEERSIRYSHELAYANISSEIEKDKTGLLAKIQRESRVFSSPLPGKFAELIMYADIPLGKLEDAMIKDNNYSEYWDDLFNDITCKGSSLKYPVIQDISVKEILSYMASTPTTETIKKYKIEEWFEIRRRLCGGGTYIPIRYG